MNSIKENRRYGEMFLLLALMILMIAFHAAAQMTSPNFQIRSSTFNSGGGQGSSVNFGVQNSTGQPMPTDISTSPNFGLFAGFQPSLLDEYILPTAEKGDCNGDGVINIFDILSVVNHILDTIPLPPQAIPLADCNDDGIINILDVLGIVNVVLGTGVCEP